MSIGAWITVPNLAVVDVMARCGFEWLVLDTEHSAIGIESVNLLAQAITARNVLPLVRVGDTRRGIITQILDTGVMGLIFPMVNSREEARQAVDFCRYPPDGSRSVGVGQAQGYDGSLMADYFREAENILVVVQIESVSAVKAADKILEVEGIDIAFIGFSDLAASMGLMGKPTHPAVVEAAQQVRDIAKRSQVSLGAMVGTWQEAKIRVDEGYQFISMGRDAAYLAAGCRESLRQLKNVLGYAIDSG